MSARWQISGRTARELVRDAEALSNRPALSAALASGAISVDQCKALTTLCREDTDDDGAWLESLPFWSLRELQRELASRSRASLMSVLEILAGVATALEDFAEAARPLGAADAMR